MRITGVRRLAEWNANDQGSELAKLAEQFDADGFSTPDGGPWTFGAAAEFIQQLWHRRAGTAREGVRRYCRLRTQGLELARKNLLDPSLAGIIDAVDDPHSTAGLAGGLALRFRWPHALWLNKLTQQRHQRTYACAIDVLTGLSEEVTEFDPHLPQRAFEFFRIDPKGLSGAITLLLERIRHYAFSVLA